MGSARDPEAIVTAANLAEFATTHWSVVVAAADTPSPESAAALETLCRAYWFPLYAYVRRQGSSPEEAQDLTQGQVSSSCRQRSPQTVQTPAFH